MIPHYKAWSDYLHRTSVGRPVDWFPEVLFDPRVLVTLWKVRKTMALDEPAWRTTFESGDSRWLLSGLFFTEGEDVARRASVFAYDGEDILQDLKLSDCKADTVSYEPGYPYREKGTCFVSSIPPTLEQLAFMANDFSNKFESGEPVCLINGREFGFPITIGFLGEA